MTTVRIDIVGIKELERKFEQRLNFLGGEGMRDYLKSVAADIRADIESEVDSFTPGRVPDLSEKYKKRKAKKFGHVYPILKASGEMLRGMRFRVQRVNGKWQIQGYFTGTKPGISNRELFEVHAKGLNGMPKRDPFRIKRTRRGEWKRRLADSLRRR